jgi:hypothetical protein
MPKMQVLAFLPSHLEPGQFTLAQRMERAGFRVLWITHTTFDKHWLTQLGAEPERILDTTMPAKLAFSQEEIQERLLRLEGGEQPFINDIIEMDRRLRRKSREFAQTYLVYIEKVLTEFLTRNDIQFVSNGRDTALHLACHKICQRIGIASVVPTILRIPDNRFGFCAGFQEAEFVRLSEVTDHHLAEAKQIVRRFRGEKSLSETSVFERRNTRYSRRILPDVGRFLTLAYRASYCVGDDVGRYSVPQLFRMYCRKRLTALQLKIAPVSEPTGGKPYILYALQMQPESSIDVLASHVADQRNLISLIAKSTPCSHDVYVKPHPEFVGGVLRKDLVAIRRIPGVRLVSPDLDSHRLIMGAAIVLTPTGTMAMESSFFGVPSIIFGKEFFRTLPGVHYCEASNELTNLIPKLIAAGHEERLDEIADFLARHLASSFTGRVTNYLGPYSEEELATLVTAYSIVYERFNASRTALACMGCELA